MNNEKKTATADHAYKKSKWAKDIDTAVKFLTEDLTSDKLDRGASPEYKKLEAWTAWMIDLGYRENDEVVRIHTQTLLPEITDEIWQFWIETVNSTSAQK
jgi:hypothetical protein